MRKQLANHDDPDDRDERGDDGWQDLAVANPTFLLERLGAECGDLQFLRELTVNGLDAIAAQPHPASGRVVWDLDWQRFEASDGKVRKLTVTDTGTGMRPDQLRRYINQLASSSREQSHTANFGVGAKVAAGSRNPHGLEYHSWHHGRGALVRFMRHHDGRWGLEPQPRPDGHDDYWRPLDERDKPWLLRGQDHGTQVVLLGRHERDDTTRAPESVTDARQHWITRHLNSRFRRFPDRIEVLVCEQLGRAQAGQLTRVEGELLHVERRAVCGGTVELSDAVACWWVLDEDHRARRREAGTWTSSGHIVAVTGDELYDLLGPTRGGYGRLQDFGVRFGYERVVIHLQPHVEPGRLRANTARTMLLLDHAPLPWTRWGDEFAAAMPEEIRRLQEHAATTHGTPRQEAIRSRVASILPLYRLSRYRPTPAPSRSPAGDRDEPPTRTPRAKVAAPTTRPSKDSDRIITADAASPSPAHGEPHADDSNRDDGADTIVDLPDVAWISARDGTRAPGDLEDQAARYHPARHELTINADFRAIKDLTAHWRDQYTGIPGAHAVIEAQVREWSEQVLIEVVLAARNSTWSQEQLDTLLSPTAFTAALLPRHLLHAMLQKRLAQKTRRTQDRKSMNEAAGRPHAIAQVGSFRPRRKRQATPRDRWVNRPVPDQARKLAERLERMFATDAELAHRLNDLHRQLLEPTIARGPVFNPTGSAPSTAIIRTSRPCSSTRASKAAHRCSSPLIPSARSSRCIGRFTKRIANTRMSRGSPSPRGRYRRDHVHPGRRADSGWLVRPGRAQRERPRTGWLRRGGLALIDPERIREDRRPLARPRQNDSSCGSSTAIRLIDRSPRSSARYQADTTT
jgi:hypothetical protein